MLTITDWPFKNETNIYILWKVFFVFKDVVGLGSMITEFQFFNTEGLFYIARLLFHDLRVDIDLQPPQRPWKGQIERPIFLI